MQLQQPADDMARFRLPPVCVLFLIVLPAVCAAAQPNPFEPPVPVRDALGHTPETQIDSLQDAAVSLPIATLLGAALALRPRRKGTPPRSAPVIQTQIILAVVGAVVMLVVGASLARAFGIVGAANLIRYRSKIDDPKDAGVMLSTLAVGLASGVGLYLLAAFSTLFILLVLWIVESHEPPAPRAFMLKVAGKEPANLRPKIEELLRRYRLHWELRGSSDTEVAYEVEVPHDRRTEKLPDAILALDQEGLTSVEWEEKDKNKKK